MTWWKGVYLALGFDARKSRKFQKLIKNKATVDATGYVSYIPLIYLAATVVGSLGYIYISAWGLRCSFRLIGQCEGLYIVRRATGTGSHAFYF